jgi:type VI secretion system protein ImpF
MWPMAELKKTDRFVPPLMQAFRAAFRERDSRKESDIRDEAGERVLASRRASPRNAVSEARLRLELADDIAALLNTTNLAAAQDLTELTHVAQSILNYGFPDLTAISIDENAAGNIGEQIRAALRAFEPRLVNSSIAVERDTSVDAASLKIRFNVHAEMFAAPVDVPLEFVADLELDSGKLKLSRL